MIFLLKIYLLILILFYLFNSFNCSVNNYCQLKYNMSANEHVNYIY